MEHEKSGASPLWYALAGAAAGLVVGVLFAPQEGRETRADLARWRRKALEDKDALAARLSAAIPFRVKAAAALGALKAGGAEALEIVKEDLHLDGAGS